jgi:hypothetical protein
MVGLSQLTKARGSRPGRGFVEIKVGHQDQENLVEHRAFDAGILFSDQSP